MWWYEVFFFFQAEDGIRDLTVTGVQTCALPDARHPVAGARDRAARGRGDLGPARGASARRGLCVELPHAGRDHSDRGPRSVPVAHAFVRAAGSGPDRVGCVEQRANAVFDAGDCRGVSARGPCLHRVGVPRPPGPDHARGDPAARGPVLIGSDCIMWYFSWILGLGLALAFGVLNAIWYEVMEDPPPEQRRENRSSPQP